VALLAGTALGSNLAYAQDQSNSGGMDQAPAAQDQGGSEELLLKDQNQATSGEETTMPDAAPEDQATTDDAQNPATPNEDQATTEELQDPAGKTEDQATSPSTDTNTDDVAQEPSDDAQQDQTATDRQRQQDQNADQDTATDTRSKNKMDDTTAAEGDNKADDNKDQAASDKPSTETTGSIDISTEQKTVIRNTIIQTKVKPVDVDVKVSIGVDIPRTIELHPLPPKVVEIVPAYRDYVYFVMADGRIVIVQPDTYEVVYIITA
jgi:hypothetical protein